MSILFTFPGQGAQREGMLHDLPQHPIVARALEEASDVLNRDVLMLDSSEALQSSVAVQISLLVAGVSMARLLMHAAGPPDAVAGLSVGAYPAAVVASALSYSDALRLVQQRARLMEAAFPSGYGMTAILGLDTAALNRLIADVHAPESPVYLANLNAPTQLVIAGSHTAMERVAELAMSNGAYATKPITMSVPSHCPLLDGAAAELAKEVAKVKISAPRLRIYSASHARELRDVTMIAADLAGNMSRPVLWHDTATLAYERGVRLSVEMPPADVLTRLATAAFADAISVAASDTRVDTISVLMARERQHES